MNPDALLDKHRMESLELVQRGFYYECPKGCRIPDEYFESGVQIYHIVLVGPSKAGKTIHRLNLVDELIFNKSLCGWGDFILRDYGEPGDKGVFREHAEFFEQRRRPGTTPANEIGFARRPDVFEIRRHGVSKRVLILVTDVDGGQLQGGPQEVAKNNPAVANADAIVFCVPPDNRAAAVEIMNSLKQMELKNPVLQVLFTKGDEWEGQIRSISDEVATNVPDGARVASTSVDFLMNVSNRLEQIIANPTQPDRQRLGAFHAGGSFEAVTYQVVAGTGTPHIEGPHGDEFPEDMQSTGLSGSFLLLLYQLGILK